MFLSTTDSFRTLRFFGQTDIIERERETRDDFFSFFLSISGFFCGAA